MIAEGSAPAETPPSCQAGGAGLTNCGANGESCCTSLEVPGGTYYRTYTNDGGGPIGEADPATVSGFRLDKYLVTVGRFRQFVAAWNGGWLPSAGTGKQSPMEAVPRSRVAKSWWSTCSALSVAKKLSATALSLQSPVRSSLCVSRNRSRHRVG